MSDPLQQPLDLPCGATLPNRICKAAMTEGLADNRLRATERHERLYRLWSEGGAGVLITGNVQVDRHCLERAGNVAIDSDESREDLARWAKAGTGNGNHLWMQISHAGRQTPMYINRHPKAPSDVQLKLLGSYGKPEPLTDAEIRELIERFAVAARTAKEAGFTGVQVHGAHGYLISEFLSPLVNQRTDDWGGSLENRARFLLETVAATRAAVGSEFPISVKLNSADFQKGGYTFEECLKVVKWLNDAGIDLLEVSGGSYEQPGMVGYQGDEDTADPDAKASTREREAYFMEYAKKVREVATMPIMVTGGFRSRQVMEAALASGDADVLGIGRPLVTDPHFVKRLFEGTVDEAEKQELKLNIGGGFLGPASRSVTLKFMNVFGQMGWFYMQLLRIGNGREADYRMGALRGLFGHLFNEYKTAFRIRGFLKEKA
ncbi:NADH:flavin oxidoreductase/NADH oxidase family protein [Spectribacter hydrogenoxidans]|uniref:NADH:flavin oxidoreductase/NADH oxidase family protein n=1 Tax=Spectribacter hydrogenoxidans TaxID=3075608 RepID=A0ABU3BZK3_9GAMM|nr:NADH:flavin oxidoreductase/NADH oxidase family protein [Salinisphaera sp. W335]MDT0634738.1 NADH:flavin oxidoreductase/NADH oxidase family protein [Salinisphaera sp. W335]